MFLANTWKIKLDPSVKTPPSCLIVAMNGKNGSEDSKDFANGPWMHITGFRPLTVYHSSVGNTFPYVGRCYIATLIDGTDSFYDRFIGVKIHKVPIWSLYWLINSHHKLHGCIRAECSERGCFLDVIGQQILRGQLWQGIRSYCASVFSFLLSVPSCSSSPVWKSLSILHYFHFKCCCNSC